jgi:20S proteasome alpha/beta subunit
MTLALAAVCTDGVVILEDKALTRMDTFELLGHDEKLRGVIRNVIFGYAGSENMYDIFIKYVVGELVMLRDDQEQQYTPVNMLSKFCSIINRLRSISTAKKGLLIKFLPVLCLCFGP